MNRRRFLGSIAAITAALGVTRVPDSVQAASDAPGPKEVAYTNAWSDGYLAAEALSYRRGFNDGQEARSDPHAHCGPDCDQWRDLLQWDWANPAVITRSGSFVSGGAMTVGYHEVKS